MQKKVLFRAAVCAVLLAPVLTACTSRTDSPLETTVPESAVSESAQVQTNEAESEPTTALVVTQPATQAATIKTTQPTTKATMQPTTKTTTKTTAKATQPTTKTTTKATTQRATASRTEKTTIREYKDPNHNWVAIPESKTVVQKYGVFKQKVKVTYECADCKQHLTYSYDEAPSDASSHFAQEKATLIRLTNEYRKKKGLSELKTAPDYFCDWADMRAKEISTVFSHTRPNGKSFETVHGELGAYGENIASGNVDGADFFEAFRVSPVHEKTMRSETATHIAVGYYIGEKGVVYCCMNLVYPK
ncbi:MAG TPA: hypothetical protein DDY98_01645 [Ruminococcaceae bacterium]|nr:hypothetical protein [Oscillospiraceae bacterium]